MNCRLRPSSMIHTALQRRCHPAEALGDGVDDEGQRSRTFRIVQPVNVIVILPALGIGLKPSVAVMPKM